MGFFDRNRKTKASTRGVAERKDSYSGKAHARDGNRYTIFLNEPYRFRIKGSGVYRVTKFSVKKNAVANFILGTGRIELQGFFLRNYVQAHFLKREEISDSGLPDLDETGLVDEGDIEKILRTDVKIT